MFKTSHLLLVSVLLSCQAQPVNLRTTSFRCADTSECPTGQMCVGGSCAESAPPLDCAAVPSDASFVRGQSCYTYHETRTDFHTAMDVCGSLGGGRLAVLATTDEAEAVLEGLELPERAWIGAARRLWVEDSTGFDWAAKELFVESAFADGEPDVPLFDKAGVVLRPDGLWEDENLFQPPTLAYICEFEPWFPASDGLEYAWFSPHESFGEGKQRCIDFGSTLANLPGQDPSQFLAILPEFVFVNATNMDFDESFHWDTGEMVDPGLVDANGEYDGCLSLSLEGRYGEIQCDHNTGVLCSRPPAAE